MKKYLRLIAMLIVGMAVSMTFTACGSDEPENPDNLIEDKEIPVDDICKEDFIGSWKYQQTFVEYLQFNSDGTGTYSGEGDYEDDAFKYSVTWNYGNGTLDIKLVNGVRLIYTVKKLTSNTMYLVDQDGYEYDYIRVDGLNNGNDGGATENGGVTTLSAEPRAYTATVFGKYSGSKQPQKVGIEYSYDKTFPNSYTSSAELEGQFGGYSVEIKGIVDLVRVYYRAFAIVDGRRIYGETKSFETKQGTYTIDGKTFKFIKVTGLATGSFSMMQTELPPSAIVTIDGENIGKLNANEKDQVTKGETREFFNHMPFIPRNPTPQEWMFAAAGGLQSKSYIYSGSNDINEVAWYASNSNAHARTSGYKNANELGFYDMSGNYYELCAAYDEEELYQVREWVKNFRNPGIAACPASYFNISWYCDGGAFGGYWGANAAECTVNSHKSYTEGKDKNKIDQTRYTFRIAYSRPD